MRLLILLIMFLFSLSANARDEGSCYISGLIGNGKSSVNYKAIEVGCEASRSNLDWVGGYVSLLLINHEGYKLGQSAGGLDFGLRKNFKVTSFESFRSIIPYLSLGSIVQFTGEKVIESGEEYQKIDNISLYSFISSIGVKMPITKKFILTPKVSYILPLRKTDEQIMWIGMAFNLIIDM